jgi:hypothetical protein
MPPDIKKYKVVRRGQKWCVCVKGVVNTTDSWHWCCERKIKYHIKQHWNTKWDHPYSSAWDYSFIFDKEYEATAFILGYL